MSREADLVEALERLVDAKALASVRALVAGWNGEGRDGAPFVRHPARLGARIETNCGAIYDLDDALIGARAALARYRTSAEGGGNEWRDPATAPKNDTLLELLVDYSADDADHPLEDDSVAATIGFNSFDSDGVDEWKFAGWCWTHDHFVQGKGKVIGWRPSHLNQEPRP